MEKIKTINIIKKNEDMYDIENNSIMFENFISKEKALNIAKVYIGEFDSKIYHYIVELENDNGIYILEEPNKEFEFIEQ